ncbi:MAG: alanyl-tRNA editing protein [Oscillibacter sp.]|nr:alanyl-tRNA editing protein [Oscillibacter sp.]
METVKLYYQDPFLREFTAQVLTCEPYKDRWQVTLDRTAFYPEGGGQPADQGTLGGVPVLDVHERGGVIFHTCGAPLTPGCTAGGVIDWARRFDHMQQHSGEHICSGIICRRYGCDNVGFHLGAGVTTIDFNTVIPPADLAEIELEANRYLYENHPIAIRFCRGAELEALEYRSKKALDGDVRIVTFPGADCCACCGTHVTTSGQVGLVKFLSCQKFREGVRIELLCGERAYRYLSAIYGQAQETGRRLSVKPGELLPAVERLEEELAALKTRTAELESTVFQSIAREQAGKGDVVLIQPAMRPDSVRRLADAVAKTCGGLAAVFAGENGVYHYALVRADGGDIAPLVKALNGALRGRGGGRKGFAQGSAETAAEEILAFFQGGSYGVSLD